MLYLVPDSVLVDKRGTSFLRHALRALRHGLMDHFGAVTGHGQTGPLCRGRFELLTESGLSPLALGLVFEPVGNIACDNDGP